MMKTNSAIPFCQLGSAFIFSIIVLSALPAHSHNGSFQSFSELILYNSEPPTEPRGNSSEGGDGGAR